VTDEPKPGRDAKRLFVGIRPAVATVAELGEVCETLARRAQTAGVPIKWVAPASYHVTVKFLGWARPEVVPAVVDAIRAAAVAAPFSFTTARLGAFPSRERATVVWAGVECEPIARLARALEDSCAALGFAREKRAFHGHVTLGRLRDPRGVSEVLLPFAEQVFSETRVHTVTLFESVTKPTGSEYRAVADLPLGAALEAQKRQSPGVESSLERIDTDDGWPRGQGPSSDD
jgi:2'-5' RNA ligase